MQTRVAATATAIATPSPYTPAETREVSEAPIGSAPAVLVVGATRNELRTLAGPASRLAVARGARLSMLFLPSSASGRRRRGANTWLRSLAGEYNAESVALCPERGRTATLGAALENLDVGLVVAAGDSLAVRELGDCTGIETLVIHRNHELSRSRRALAVVEAASRARLTVAAAEGVVGSGEGRDGEVVLLRVVPPGTSQEEQDAIQARTEASLPPSPQGIRRIVRVVGARSIEAATLGALRHEEFDLLALSAAQEQLAAGRTTTGRLAERVNIPVIVAGRPAPALDRRIGDLGNAVFRLLPSLTEAERMRTYSSMRRSARGGPDFTFLIIVATAIAGLGLCANSATVIIGAMLVAPLMTPIMGLGMGVSVGDARLVRISAQSIMRGVVTVLAVGLTLGFLIPVGSLTGEMVAPTHPAPLDVAVALASGAGGAYALCRRGAASALPGVAIAVSLVPPLTTSGIAAAAGQEQAAAGASLLFLLNLTAVSFASTVVFLWLGFRPHADRIGRLRLFARGFGGLSLLLLSAALPVIWLTWHANSSPSLETRVGQALTAAVDQSPGTELRSFQVTTDAAGETSVRLQVGASGPLDQSALTRLQDAASRAAGRRVGLTLDFFETTHLPAEQIAVKRDP
ncbi:MAG: DUF389 domain-containing protein [Dehalococcoidia bacterium]